MRPLGRGHVHFNLYRDQFASDCQTVWDGNLLECNKALNFFIWPSDAWKLRFWPIFKKSLADFGLLVHHSHFEKKNLEKNDENFFFLFVFIMFCWLYHVTQTRYSTPKLLFNSLWSQENILGTHYKSYSDGSFGFDIFD